jgi:hypothetical protein
MWNLDFIFNLELGNLSVLLQSHYENIKEILSCSILFGKFLCNKYKKCY